MHGRGGMYGGACMAGGVWQGACIAGGCEWQGMHGRGGMCGRGVCGRRACVVGGRVCAWQERRPLQRTVRMLLKCLLVFIELSNVLKYP